MQKEQHLNSKKRKFSAFNSADNNTRTISRVIDDDDDSDYEIRKSLKGKKDTRAADDNDETRESESNDCIIIDTSTSKSEQPQVRRSARTEKL